MGPIAKTESQQNVAVKLQGQREAHMERPPSAASVTTGTTASLTKASLKGSPQGSSKSSREASPKITPRNSGTTTSNKLNDSTGVAKFSDKQVQSFTKQVSEFEIAVNKQISGLSFANFGKQSTSSKNVEQNSLRRAKPSSPPGSPPAGVPKAQSALNLNVNRLLDQIPSLPANNSTPIANLGESPQSQQKKGKNQILQNNGKDLTPNYKPPRGAPAGYKPEGYVPGLLNRGYVPTKANPKHIGVGMAVGAAVGLGIGLPVVGAAVGAGVGHKLGKKNPDMARGLGPIGGSSDMAEERSAVIEKQNRHAICKAIGKTGGIWHILDVVEAGDLKNLEKMEDELAHNLILFVVGEDAEKCDQISQAIVREIIEVRDEDPMYFEKFANDFDAKHYCSNNQTNANNSKHAAGHHHSFKPRTLIKKS